MTLIRRLAAGALAVVLLAVPLGAMLFLTGCRKEDQIFVDTNLAPDTRLTSAPAPYSQANYRVHMYWDGTDPDGYVVAYYFAWDDTVTSAWVYTTRTDSFFKALIDTAGETRRHTFYVRSVDNEGKLDPSPARVRFDAWTALPVVDSLLRLDGPEDPSSPNYDPGYKDTVLMGSPCTFAWTGWDPDGMGALVDFSYRLDSSPFSAFSAGTTATETDISSGTHFFYVKAEDETGAESFPTSYKFVMNYEPDSEITAPTDPTGTLTVPDGDRIVFHWTVRDREELEGVGGGISHVIIELDTGFQKIFEFGSADYQEHWMFTSDTLNQASDHYISSVNLPTGGNRSHEFRVYARDVEGRFETPSNQPDDREKYVFWYNFPPTTVTTYPDEGDTLCPDFTIRWDGSDLDGSVVAYQYVLDPMYNSWKQTEADSMFYEDIEPGEHEFRVRARDDSDCWEAGYQVVRFWVQECK